ncbi:MAG: MFS transporter [Candidatus Thermoplasmatota archaeon]|nr:MFS transporter [Candidatus Thermoplasmatota archaeon]
MGLGIFLRRKYSEFTKLFWVTILMELFERGAYYASYGILAVHLAYNLKLTNLQLGLLNAQLYLLLYAGPLVSGALADRVGYKKALRYAFTFMMAGYFLLGAMSIPIMYYWSLGSWSVFGIFFVIYIILGIGAGTFKPIVSATIGKTTTEEKRNLAYMTFYWFVNLGAFIFPMIFGIIFLIISLYVPDKRVFYYIIFFVSSVFIAINYMINKMQYQNPDPPNKDADVFRSIRNIGIVLKDKPFVILLAIYSGFFIMFGLMHVTLPLYMVDFKIMPLAFSVLFLATINPGTIIIVGPVLAGIANKFESLELIITGILLFIFGLFIMGYTTISIFFILGIVIFSCGEFIAHPNYSSYISKIAPRDKLAIYMGASFLPSAVGVITGSIFAHGVLYENIAAAGERPKLFWAIMVSIGVLTVALLLIYNRVYGTRGAPSVEPGEQKSFRKKFMASNLSIVVILLLIPGFLAMGYFGGQNTYYRDEKEKTEIVFNLENYEIIPGFNDDSSGNLQEEESAIVPIVPYELVEGDLLKSVTIELVWTDEDDFTRLFRTWENQPDQFQLSVTAGDNPTMTEIGANTHGQEGSISVTMEFDHESGESLNGTGKWIIEVTLVSCGNMENPSSPIAYTDSSNDYDVFTTSEVYTPR